MTAYPESIPTKKLPLRNLPQKNVYMKDRYSTKLTILTVASLHEALVKSKLRDPAIDKNQFFNKSRPQHVTVS